MGSIGILLTNLGTPDAPTPQALRRYLKEFLWDPRVVDLPRPLWWLILNGIILNTRPRKSAQLYQSIWTEAGSPLLIISEKIRSALQAILPHSGHVALGMRYGNPSIASALRDLRDRGCTQLVVLPLYPQYFAGTTASTFDAVADTLKTWRAIPELHFIRDYHDHPLYIEALATSIRGFWAEHGEPQQLLLSFHGIPKRYVALGDPYYEQCKSTAARIADALRLPAERWQLTFQSRFGRDEWLEPYTDTTLRALPAQGFTRIDVVCPGFAADCLETLQEAAMENRRIFLDAGGREYRYIPALNDRPEHIEALTQIALRVSE